VSAASGRAAVAEQASPPVVLHVTTVPMTLTFLGGQVGYMKASGFEVHAASSPGPELERFGAEERVPVSAVRMERRITPWADLRALVALIRVIRRVRPTLVHSHTPKGGLLGMLAASAARVPVRIYHMRGLPLVVASGLRRKLLWWTERIACMLADEVLCVSHSLRDTALHEGLCEPDRIHVLAGGSGQGVDAGARFNPDRVGPEARAATRKRLGVPASATVIGFVGRIVRDKGIVELVDAWKRIRAAHPEAHLMLVGPFEPQDPVPPETEAALRDDPRVHLVGLDWNTPPLYAAMDVVVLPTYREGFPNVPLEAAAMGLPVVATRVPGCVDAVADGFTGTLVPARDAAELTRALTRYLEDPELGRRHGRAGRERVLQEFRQEVIWESLRLEYLRLLASRGIPGPAAARRSAEGVQPATLRGSPA
jgi:glycosyltransferase involved in cell wall biosynthesis